MWSKVKALDDRVLGSSDSTRGFVFNALSGLHPAMVPVWFGVVALALLFAPLAFFWIDTRRGVTALVVAVACALMGYVSRGMPDQPRK